MEDGAPSSLSGSAASRPEGQQRSSGRVVHVKGAGESKCCGSHVMFHIRRPVMSNISVMWGGGGSEREVLTVHNSISKGVVRVLT